MNEQANVMPFRAFEGTINITEQGNILHCENPFALKGDVYATIIGRNQEACIPYKGIVVHYHDQNEAIKFVEDINKVPFWQIAEFWIKVE